MPARHAGKLIHNPSKEEKNMPDAIRTAPREDRTLSGPAITFSIAEEIRRLRQEPEWISGVRNSVTVVKTANLSVVLIAIKKDASLCGHEVDGPITLQVISGAVKFGVAGEPLTLTAGTVIALDKSVPHDIHALDDSELLLTIVKEVK
jgi:quercetin dioxygenase-like cupin family protein